MRWTQAYVNVAQGWAKHSDIRMDDGTLAAQVFKDGGIYRVLASPEFTNAHLFADAVTAEEAEAWAVAWMESLV